MRGLPFVLPHSLLETESRTALVLAYGKLSELEACTVLENQIGRAESPCERVAVLEAEPGFPSKPYRLAGIHKCAPVLGIIGQSYDETFELVKRVSSFVEEKATLAISAYDISEERYDELVRSVLDSFKVLGFRKVRLLRPRDNELMAESVVSRNAVDLIAFPYRNGIGFGPTVWVPDSLSMRRRGTQKPSPRQDISLSPRLARVLLNLAKLDRGMTVLDPFCGSGTILAEAFTMSLKCLGLDSRASRVQEARENLHWSGGQGKRWSYDIRKGDARELYRLLRGTKVDAVVTEPILLPKLEARPKVSTAMDMIGTAAETYSAALASMANSIVPGGRIVVVVPIIQTIEDEEVALKLDGRSLGLTYAQPGPVGFEYPVRLSFESTRWIKRAVYVFESRS